MAHASENKGSLTSITKYSKVFRPCRAKLFKMSWRKFWIRYGSVRALTHSVMILLEQFQEPIQTLQKRRKTGIKMLRLSRRRVRALVEIVCTCPHRKRDCVAGGSWAGNEIINLQVRVHSKQQLSQPFACYHCYHYVIICPVECILSLKNFQNTFNEDALMY